METNEGTLLEKASRLQGEVSWVREYHARWTRIMGLCKAQLKMCEENKKADPAAIDALNSVITLSQNKADKCASWLKDKEPELQAINREVFHNGD